VGQAAGRWWPLVGQAVSPVWLKAGRMSYAFGSFRRPAPPALEAILAGLVLMGGIRPTVGLSSLSVRLKSRLRPGLAALLARLGF
jgi:hypothetical protein